MDGPEILIPLTAVISIFIGFPWLIFHYITKWKQAKVLPREDEALLGDMHDTARRLEDRVITIERIMAAENPNWKSGL